MEIVASDSQEFEYEKPPQGQHVARCWKIVDLGTQKTVFEGNEKEQRKIKICFEIPGEMREFEYEGETISRPMSISKKMTLTLSQKGALRKFLEPWRGKPFTKQELEGFDICKLLGVAAFIQISHDTGKDGNVYANISTIMMPPKGMDVPKAVNEPIIFTFQEEAVSVFEKLSKSERKAIRLSPEFAAWEFSSQFDSEPPTVDGSQQQEEHEEDPPF